MTIAITELRLTCPVCKARIRGIERMAHATGIATRTCRCGQRWRIKVSPVSTKSDRVIDRVEWAPMARNR